MAKVPSSTFSRGRGLTEAPFPAPSFGNKSPDHGKGFRRVLAFLLERLSHGPGDALQVSLPVLPKRIVHRVAEQSPQFGNNSFDKGGRATAYGEGVPRRPSLTPLPGTRGRSPFPVRVTWRGPEPRQNLVSGASLYEKKGPSGFLQRVRLHEEER